MLMTSDSVGANEWNIIVNEAKGNLLRNQQDSSNLSKSNIAGDRSFYENGKFPGLNNYGRQN